MDVLEVWRYRNWNVGRSRMVLEHLLCIKRSVNGWMSVGGGVGRMTKCVPLNPSLILVRSVVKPNRGLGS